MATYSQQDVIKRFMASLDKSTLSGGKALDEAIRACSSFSGFEALKAQILSDCRNNNADTFLREYCGIILNNADTGAVTGSDMGGSKAKSAESIVPEGSDALDTNTKISSITTEGVTFKLAQKVGNNYSAITFNDLNGDKDKEYVWRAATQWWFAEGLKLIEDSYLYSFYSDDATVKEIMFAFEDDPDSTMLAWTNWHTNGQGKTTKLVLVINTNYYHDFHYSDKNGANDGTEQYLDRTIVHELTHCIMKAKINHANELPMIITEGMAELTHGIDDERKYDISNLAGNANLLDKALVLNTNYNKVTGVHSPDYAGGYILLRYLAKQASTSYPPTIATVNGTASANVIYNTVASAVVNAAAGNDTVINSSANFVSISGGAGNDSISNSNGNFITIDGGAGADSIYSFGGTVQISGGNDADYIYLYNNASDTTVDGGAGDDEIYSGARHALIDGGTGNDYIRLFTAASQTTINGGKGNDRIVNYSTLGTVYKYAAGDGNDSIYGFSAKDTLKITGGSYETLSGTGSDVTVRVDSGYVILKSAKGQTINIDGEVKRASVSLTSGKDSYTNSVGGATIYALAGNDTITDTGSNVVIYGGAGNDKISLGSSAKNVTVEGGAGNDTIYSSGSSNIFRYSSGDGKDTISGLGTSDTLHITSGSISKASVSGSDVVLTVGSGTINLKNYKGKSFNLKIGSGSAVSTVISDSSGKVISLTGGNDNYANTLGSATIYGLAGNDTIRNLGAKNVMLDGGAGKDSIFSYGSGTTINAGNDADYVYIYSNSTDTKVIGGAGNDSIVVGSYNYVTVNAGAGNDTVVGNRNTYGVLYQYKNGDGNDVITSVNANDTLHITSGSISKASVSGSDVLLTVGSGTINLKNYKGKSFNLKIGSGSAISTVIGGTSGNVVSLTAGADSYANSVSGAKIYGLGGNDTISNTTTGVTIYGGAGNDKLDNRNRNVLIYGDAGNDSILNTSTNVTIYGGAGADSIENHSASSGATIHGDAGNDTIKSNGSFAQIFGDAGNDKISLGSYAKNVTVEGGAGNDTLYSNGASNLFRYSARHGNDTIIGSGSNDTLQISASYTTSVKGSDLIVKVGSNSITVKNYSASKINITRGGSNGYWFADDANFLGGTTLDDISKVTAENYSIVRLSATNFENLAQDNFPTITSGEK